MRVRRIVDGAPPSDAVSLAALGTATGATCSVVVGGATVGTGVGVAGGGAGGGGAPNPTGGW